MTSSPKLIVSVSGIRGIVGTTLTPNVAMRFAQALGTWVGGRSVVLSRDSRPSGAMLGAAISAGLTSCGCQVFDLGIAPTPTVGVAIRQLGAAGGIQVSASHNPAPYNGLKLFGSGGNVIPPAEGAAVLQLYEEGKFRQVDGQTTGHVVPSAGVVRTHLVQILKHLNVAAIRERRFNVFVDNNHGAGGPLATELLHDELGCQVQVVGLQPSGDFLHEPEPTEANLRSTTARLQAATTPLALGCALDPDADRLALLDEKGRYVGEELTLVLAAMARLRHACGPVVANMSTSRLLEDVARQRGCAFHRSPVGEAHVVRKMQEVHAVLGGEGNGGVIDPRIGWVRDPFIGMALILQLLAETGKTVSQLVASLPGYVIVKDKYEVSPERLPALYQHLRQRWPEARVNEEDGLRLDWEDRWVHVRPSNTEPIVRVIAEAPQAARAEHLCKEVGGML